MSSSEVHEGRRLPTKLVTLARDSQSARTAYGWYGPEQVDRLICCSMKHLVGSGRWMLHANFASLVPRMPRRAREGFKIIAVYQYCDDRWESRSEVFIVPSEFPTVDNQDAGIYIYASTEHTPPEIPNKVKKRMSEVKETGEAFIVQVVLMSCCRRRNSSIIFMIRYEKMLSRLWDGARSVANARTTGRTALFGSLLKILA